MGLRIPGIKLDRFFIGRYGAVVDSGLLVDGLQICLRLGIVLVDGKGFFKLFNGLQEHAL